MNVRCVVCWGDKRAIDKIRAQVGVPVIKEEQRRQIERYVLFGERPESSSVDSLQTLLDSGEEEFEVYRVYSLCKQLIDDQEPEQAIATINNVLHGSPDLRVVTEAKLLYLVGKANNELRKHSLAIESLSKAKQLASDVGELHFVATINLELASISTNAGDTIRSIALYEEALLLFARQPHTEKAGQIRAQANLASAYLRVERPDDALEILTRLAESEAAEIDYHMRAALLLNLAIAYKRAKQNEASLEVYQRVHDHAKTHSMVEFQLNALIGITDHFVKVGDLSQARSTITEASKLLSNSEVAHRRCDVQAHMADVSHAEGDVVTAVNGLQQAFNTAMKNDNTSLALHWARDLAVWQAELEDYPSAYQTQKIISDIQQTFKEREVEHAVDLARVRSGFDTESELIKQRDEERNKVLHSVLPQNIANRLMLGEDRIADMIPSATVLFADIVGFTTMASKMDPGNLVDMLENLFTAMDEIASRHSCERIKTIGDAYMAISVNHNERIHVERMANVALELADTTTDNVLSDIRLRIGLHCGPVVAGVMKGSRLSYDVWGDTVNVASRMEELSNPGRVLCSQEVATILSGNTDYVLEKRKPLDVHGKGLLTTFWLNSV